MGENPEQLFAMFARANGEITLIIKKNQDDKFSFITNFVNRCEKRVQKS